MEDLWNQIRSFDWITWASYAMWPIGLVAWVNTWRLRMPFWKLIIGLFLVSYGVIQTNFSERLFPDLDEERAILMFLLGSYGLLCLYSALYSFMGFFSLIWASTTAEVEEYDKNDGIAQQKGHSFTYSFRSEGRAFDWQVTGHRLGFYLWRIPFLSPEPKGEITAYYMPFSPDFCCVNRGPKVSALAGFILSAWVVYELWLEFEKIR